MPVTKSAKKALSVATRRRGENLIHKTNYKRAAKEVRKAVAVGTTDVAALMSDAQSRLDRAAKSNTIHRNKAARLKSRLTKHVATALAAPAAEEKPKKKAVVKKVAAKKATTATKKAAPKKKA